MLIFTLGSFSQSVVCSVSHNDMTHQSNKLVVMLEKRCNCWKRVGLPYHDSLGTKKQVYRIIGNYLGKHEWLNLHSVILEMKWNAQSYSGIILQIWLWSNHHHIARNTIHGPSDGKVGLSGLHRGDVHTLYSSAQEICIQKIRNAFQQKEIEEQMTHFKSTFTTRFTKVFSEITNNVVPKQIYTLSFHNTQVSSMIVCLCVYFVLIVIRFLRALYTSLPWFAYS